jgi:hypothetical protein
MSKTKKMEENIAKVDRLTSKGSISARENFIIKTHDKNYCESLNSAIPKLAKLDFLKYNRMDDPTSWICSVEQFFEYQQSEEDEEKLPLTAYHLEGEAQM